MTPTAAPPVPRVHTITDAGRTLGFIVIDSTVAGRARGGLRMVADLTEAELRAAARSMTLKYGFLGLPQGGAKAGLIGENEAPTAERHARLLAFARAALPLLRSKTYIPDEDLGTMAMDIRWMMTAIGAVVRPRDWRANRSGDYTAHSCFASARAAAECLELPLHGARIAIEGFGKVGTALARLFASAGARVVAVSTSAGALYDVDGLSVADLVDRARSTGSRFVLDHPRRVEREALLELPVDLLCPCARFQSIHAGNADRVQARGICAGANDPVSPEAERRLIERGVLCLPDFVTNCGGVLGGTLEFAGVRLVRVDRLVEEVVGDQVRRLIEDARRDGVALRDRAETLALARHAEARARVEQPTLAQRFMGAGLEAYRRGWLPQWLMARIAPRYVSRRFE